ncbi:hypothetical protein K435DRAFT_875480 [Dendrothele bispora CBS 962.96]|uniref:Uncharacterized protein n=1 Tax=Dendrothele bispora (strain CBS 962.96) TaxID=1314807 RepID=A0A4S8KU73_DENBC|nr:hypothetical protein K435DRAFT_875480 [Dendrothele bispora CBS 962.96]
MLLTLPSSLMHTRLCQKVVESQRVTGKDLWLKTFPDAKVNDRKGWPKSTFYHHRRWWRSTTATVQQRYTDAGRTDLGLWSKFMMEVPAPGVDVKSARQKAAREVKRLGKQKVIEEEVEEWEDEDFIPPRRRRHARADKFVRVPSEGEEDELDSDQ